MKCSSVNVEMFIPVGKSFEMLFSPARRIHCVEFCLDSDIICKTLGCQVKVFQTSIPGAIQMVVPIIHNAWHICHTLRRNWKQKIIISYHCMEYDFNHLFHIKGPLSCTTQITILITYFTHTDWYYWLHMMKYHFNYLFQI